MCESPGGSQPLPLSSISLTLAPPAALVLAHSKENCKKSQSSKVLESQKGFFSPYVAAGHDFVCWEIIFKAALQIDCRAAGSEHH